VKVTLAGIAAGTALGLSLAQALRDSLYGISPADPATIAGVVALLSGVVAISSASAVRRATRVDPATALRGE
jgi:ABC-type antimicrobial peptide transport system permease subunit